LTPDDGSWSCVFVFDCGSEHFPQGVVCESVVWVQDGSVHVCVVPVGFDEVGALHWFGLVRGGDWVSVSKGVRVCQEGSGFELS